MTTQTEAIRITGQPTESQSSILTPQAIEFLLALHTRFEPVRQSLLEERKQRQARLDAGEKPQFREVSPKPFVKARGRWRRFPMTCSTGEWRLPALPTAR